MQKYSFELSNILISTHDYFNEVLCPALHIAIRSKLITLNGTHSFIHSYFSFPHSSAYSSFRSLHAFPIVHSSCFICDSRWWVFHVMCNVCYMLIWQRWTFIVIVFRIQNCAMGLSTFGKTRRLGSSLSECDVSKFLSHQCDWDRYFGKGRYFIKHSTLFMFIGYRYLRVLSHTWVRSRMMRYILANKSVDLRR